MMFTILYHITQMTEMNLYETSLYLYMCCTWYCLHIMDESWFKQKVFCLVVWNEQLDD